MANVLKSLSPAVIDVTDAFVEYYQVPSATNFVVSMLHIANVTSSAATVSICLTGTSGTPTAANAILWDVSIAANDVLEILKGDVWPTGTELHIKASANSTITVKVSGIEQS